MEFSNKKIFIFDYDGTIADTSKFMREHSKKFFLIWN